MDDLNYDMVIVGAGPAGSVTAKYAVKNGAKVIMLEKRQEIGAPVRCGEGLSLEGRLDTVDIKIDPKAIARDIDGARIFSPKGYCLKVGKERAGDECGANIYRPPNISVDSPVSIIGGGSDDHAFTSSLDLTNNVSGDILKAITIVG